MLVITWLVIFTIACGNLHQTLVRRLPAVLGGMFGILLFAVLAFGALNLEAVSGGSIAYSSESQVLSFLSLGGIAINFIFTVAAIVGELPTGSPADRSDIV